MTRGDRQTLTNKAALTAGIVNDEVLANDASLRLSPAIYQEIIPGSKHLRVNAFGDDIYAALITCDQLDWRFHLAASEFQPFELTASIKQRLISVLRLLNLRMGIFDLKLNSDGDPVWLEINPQGQFLFVEGLAEIPLGERFAEFLFREATGTEHTPRITKHFN